MNSPHDIDKAYISPYDRFLHEFEATHTKSASQRQEMKKYARIFALRDNVKPDDEMKALWDKF